jgi:hypothetical protein
VLALDGGLYTFVDGELQPLTTSIPVPISHMRRYDETIWLFGGGRLFRWVDDAVSEISLPDYSTITNFAVAGDRLYLSVPWLVEVAMDGSALAVHSVGEIPVESLATDAADNLWMVIDGGLFLKRPDEPMREIVLPEPVTEVMGPAIWIQGEKKAYRYQEAILSEHPMAEQGWLGVDGHGRLVQLTEGELVRHSIDRPVVVIGLSESLMIQETAVLLPSDPQSLSNLSVWLDSEPLQVTSEPWSVVVDPTKLTSGAHTLRFFSESDLGDRQDEHPVWVVELPEVSFEEIEAISEAHCIGCHGGATLTDLSTKADWERLIDSIIYQVSINSMPQNGPYLSPEQILMIRGWKHGGFQ